MLSMANKHSSLSANEHTLSAMAIEHTPVGIVCLQPVLDNRGDAVDFEVLFTNSSFCNLVENKIAPGDRLGKYRQEIVNQKVWSLLCLACRTNSRMAETMRLQKEALSLVMEIVIVPVGGQLVVSWHDVTKISHHAEMLEQQTTLLDENSRALEGVRAALEAEVLRRGNLESKLRMLADTDELSGLANRRAFMEKAAGEYLRARRYNHPLCLVMLDLDKFKRINDTHGHAAGDQVIIVISQICESLSRSGVDCVGRLGGEEFAILLSECTMKEAHGFAERLRLVIETTPVFYDVTKISATASMGVAELLEEDANIAAVIKRADNALYLSKNAGRNRVSAG